MEPVSNPADQYTAHRRVRHIETEDFHATELWLAPGQFIGWHMHSDISDTFYVFAGRIRVTYAAPAEVVEVAAGETLKILPGRPHLVENMHAAPAAFLLLQGVGKCDFVPCWVGGHDKRTVHPEFDAAARQPSPTH